MPRLARLRKLDLRGNLLEAVPSSFVSPHLEELDLSENRIAALPADCFAALQALRVLDLHQNRLTALQGFPAGSKLETILLSSNRLTRLTGLSADTTPDLKVLDLKDNKLTEFEDAFFTLASVHTLDITNNEFNRLPAELGLFAALRKFLVVGNPLRTIRNEIKQGSTEKLKKYLADLIDVSKLGQGGPGGAKAALARKELTAPEEQTDFGRLLRSNMANNAANLTNQKLTVIPKDILALEGLAGVVLSKNQLTAFPVVLADLRNLRTLTLSENAIERVSVADLRRFDALETLELQSNRLASFCDDFDAYDKTPYLPSLRTLDLSQNRLTSLSAFLAWLPRLNSLSVGYNGLTSIEPLLCQGNDVLETLAITNNKVEAISENVANLLRLSAFLAENNNIKNFPPELAFLNLKTFSILGNPSLLATEKMSSKGTAHLLAHLKNKLTPDKEARHAAFVKAWKPRTVPSLDKAPEPTKPEARIPSPPREGPADPAKELPRESPKEPFTPGSTSRSQAAGWQSPPQQKLDVFGQPIPERKPSVKTAPPAEPESKPPTETQAHPPAEKVATPEQTEMRARVDALQLQLDTDFNLNNVKKLTIRKELNALKAKLNQG